MAGPVKIRIDLSAGVVEVEAGAENIDAVFNRLDSFIPRLSEAYDRPPENGDTSAEVNSQSAASKPAQSGDTSSSKPVEQKGGSQRSAKSSKGKEAYKAVDLGLSEAKRAELRAFYAAKQPNSQNEQIAVLMDWLKRDGGRATAGMNEVFTAFRTVEAKSPAKISSVLGNMVGLSWVKSAGNGQYELIHVGEDHVKFKLPKVSKAVKA